MYKWRWNVYFKNDKLYGVCIVVEKKICYIGVSDREKNSSFLKIFMVECD